MLGRVLVAEDLQHFLRVQIGAHSSRLHDLFDRRGHPPQGRDPLFEQRMLAPQVLERVRMWVVDEGLHRFKREPQLAVGKDALQPLKVRRRILAVARPQPPAGAQQAEVVIVPQRAHSDASDARDLAD
jgi:hypothetical protein